MQTISTDPRHAIGFVLAWSIAAILYFQSAQPPTPGQRDIVRVLAPPGMALRKVPAGDVPKEQAIQELNAEKKQASGKRLEKIAYLLAVLGADYQQNRDYLLSVFRDCTAARNNAGCSEDTGAYLVNLYRRGHHELLSPLLDGAKSRQASLDELLGSFYSELISQVPSVFIKGIQQRPAGEQKNLCYMAGAGDGSGMPIKNLTKTRKALRALPGEVARQCLQQVEEANKRL